MRKKKCGKSIVFSHHVGAPFTTKLSPLLLLFFLSFLSFLFVEELTPTALRGFPREEKGRVEELGDIACDEILVVRLVELHKHGGHRAELCLEVEVRVHVELGRHGLRDVPSQHALDLL